ncbi:MAG: sigma 54-interacting transcriptional regulator [Pseudoflavonifractor sp.]|nr:sigma 54-interacting transcriptional regulator [Alloprevotella sp.]MCM1116877.1 sigma 54-interacting transcriptional regulator [Pseudoflavonifractor sp.]
MELTVARGVDPEVTRAKQRFGIIGSSPALLGAVERAIRVAPIDLSVLVTGESGSGKEFFPKIIHAYSPRKHAKYIAVNCGAIPEGTIDSELFGHEKGSFTGAVAARKGYFEEADGGTIFLDEVAELPMTTQARLLRVLETGEYLRVGSSEVKRTNIRVVAATNMDMVKAVAEGRFREDLYYRLSTVSISVPPLRDRGNDISLLARKFAADFSERYRTPQLELTDDARRDIQAYRWPGNVRQLKNVIEQMALFEGGNGPVSGTVMKQYLPAGAGINAPALAAERVYDYQQEREILFNMVFRMQRRIDELASELSSVRQATQPTVKPEPTTVTSFLDSPQPLLPHYTGPETKETTYPGLDNATIVEVEEVAPHEDVSEIDSESGVSTPLTLEDTERRRIIEALDRNGGRRKATAKELGIAERTLYRKIKEYGLEG